MLVFGCLAVLAILPAPPPPAGAAEQLQALADLDLEISIAGDDGARVEALRARRRAASAEYVSAQCRTLLERARHGAGWESLGVLNGLKAAIADGTLSGADEAQVREAIAELGEILWQRDLTPDLQAGRFFRAAHLAESIAAYVPPDDPLRARARAAAERAASHHLARAEAAAELAGARQLHRNLAHALGATEPFGPASTELLQLTEVQWAGEARGRCRAAAKAILGKLPTTFGGPVTATVRIDRCDHGRRAWKELGPPPHKGIEVEKGGTRRDPPAPVLLHYRELRFTLAGRAVLSGRGSKLDVPIAVSRTMHTARYQLPTGEWTETDPDLSRRRVEAVAVDAALRLVLDGATQLKASWAERELIAARRATAAGAELEADHHFFVAARLTGTVAPDAAAWWEARHGVPHWVLPRAAWGLPPETPVVAIPVRLPPASRSK